MITTINGRTPEEIKKGLECCPHSFTSLNQCYRCPYEIACYAVKPRDILMKDALAYIQQLERERDEAVRAPHGVCKACIHYNGHYPPGDIMSCCKFEECLYGMGEWDAEDHWQWRGVQEVE